MKNRGREREEPNHAHTRISELSRGDRRDNVSATWSSVALRLAKAPGHTWWLVAKSGHLAYVADLEDQERLVSAKNRNSVAL